MKKIILVLLATGCLFACNNNDIPDVSDIKVDIPIERFDQDFFAVDTNYVAAGLQKLEAQHPDFYPDFMKEILGVNGNPSDTTTLMVTRQFISGYRPIYDSLQLKYKDLNWLKKELEKAYQFVKYYFPSYKTGKAIIFIGPFDMAGTALTRAGLAIGLHQYAGKDFSVYQDAVIQQIYPSYISRRFEPEYITTNAMRAVVQDLYPEDRLRKGLVEQMIEKGKQWWLLDKLLPHVPDSIKTGYTGNQVLFAERNEGMIWQTIVTNEKNIFTIDPVAIQMYIGEAPFTANMGSNSPGNIGPWVGWQIVKKYVANNSSKSIDEIMKTDAKKILEGSKYKPK